MKAFRSVLVPTDFSEASQRAIAVGADLARCYEASLMLVHVFEPVPYAFPEAFTLSATDQANVIAHYQRHLATAQRDALSAGAPTVETRVLQGRAAATIVEQAKSAGIDLIVIASHSRGGLTVALLGSVAEKVSRMAPCPVLIVRPPHVVGSPHERA